MQHKLYVHSLYFLSLMKENHQMSAAKCSQRVEKNIERVINDGIFI